MTTRRVPSRNKTHGWPGRPAADQDLARDPRSALNTLRRADRDIKNAFDAGSREGDAALKRHDRTALAEAVHREGQAIDAHVRLTKKTRRG